MKKEVIIRVNSDGKFKISRFIRYFDTRKTSYFVCYKGKFYKKEAKNIKIRQVTQLVEALNIKDKKERLSYIYDKACDILDDKFNGNVCCFKDNKCIQDKRRINKQDGCCASYDGKKYCKYLVNHRCITRCMACKFHTCFCLKKQGYKYKVKDILILKYLLNWKQKIMVYLDFFKAKDDVLKDIYKNSIILWAIRKDKSNFINDYE